MLLDLTLALATLLVALAVQPWRAARPDGPPWPWLAWWAAMPLLWGADQLARMPLVQPLSGAALLVLMAGWPLAMLALLPAAAVLMVMAGLPAAEALHRAVWLGMLPGTLALGLGTLVRRLLPGHLFIYILGRAFLATWVAVTLAGALALAVTGAPQGTEPADLLLARFLAASGDAFLTGMVAAIFVAFRPQWLATYADRLYLPRD
jgi:uncharacterized membrane protein